MIAHTSVMWSCGCAWLELAWQLLNEPLFNHSRKQLPLTLYLPFKYNCKKLLQFHSHTNTTCNLQILEMMRDQLQLCYLTETISNCERCVINNYCKPNTEWVGIAIHYLPKPAAMESAIQVKQVPASKGRQAVVTQFVNAVPTFVRKLLMELMTC